MVLDYSVTRRILTLGSQDSTTGWYAKQFLTTQTIDMIVVPKGSQHLRLIPGGYVRFDALGVCCSPVLFGDEVLWESTYYEVKGVRPQKLGDSHLYYFVDLVELPFHEA